MHAPKFWYRKANRMSKFLTKLLMPISAIWKIQTAHNISKPSIKIDIPVICVGNINMGGTGKTPTAIYIAQTLKQNGKTPFILTRGYGGSIVGPALVNAAHTAQDVGDEAVLMACFVPVVVAKDRVVGGKFAQSKGADIVILDDGFQNPSLYKDTSIVVIDSDVGFGNGHVFPSGPLRETIETAKARASHFLLIGRGKKRSEIETELGSGIPISYGHLAPVETGIKWKGMRVLAFAGIGRPQKFFDTLGALGADIISKRSFGDHEEIPRMLLERMQKEAWGLGANLVTTEKDAARLPKEWQGSVLSLPVRLQIDDGDDFCQMVFE